MIEPATLATIAIGLTAALGYAMRKVADAIRAWSEAHALAAQTDKRDADTHAGAVAAIEAARAAAERRADQEAAAHDETRALLAAEQERTRRLHLELSRQMTGRAVRPKE